MLIAKKYTVVLLRPKYLTSEFGIDIYVALVQAKDEYKAMEEAQKEVFKADKKDKMFPMSRSDYKLICLFEGHHDCKLFGWEV